MITRIRQLLAEIAKEEHYNISSTKKTEEAINHINATASKDKSTEIYKQTDK